LVKLRRGLRHGQRSLARKAIFLTRVKDGPLPAGYAILGRARGRLSPWRRPAALVGAGDRVDELRNRSDRTDQQLNERPNPPSAVTLGLDFLGHLSFPPFGTVPAMLAGELGRFGPRGAGPIACKPFLLKSHIGYPRASETDLTGDVPGTALTTKIAVLRRLSVRIEPASGIWAGLACLFTGDPRDPAGHSNDPGHFLAGCRLVLETQL
jgi:hypothetical protein